MSDRFDSDMNNLVPMVVEQTNRGERAYDIYSRLLKGAYYLSGRASRRRRFQSDLRPTAVSGGGKPEQGHQLLHQFAGRCG
jgi:hypothetical protein